MAFEEFKTVIEENIDFESMDEASISEKINEWYEYYLEDPFIVGYNSFIEEWFPEEEFSKATGNYEFHLKN